MSIIKKDSGGFLKAKDTRSGEIWEILEAKENEKNDFNGKPKLAITLSIRNEDEDVFRVDLNSTSKNNLIDAYGYETNDWVGKSVKAEIAENQKVGNAFKDILYFTHPNRTLKGEIIGQG